MASRNGKYLDNVGLSTLWGKIKSLVETAAETIEEALSAKADKTEALAGGVAIEITGTTSTDDYHFGYRSTDSAKTSVATYDDALYVRSDVSTIYVSYDSGIQITALLPSDDGAFTNGQRITLIGYYFVNQADGDYALSPYAYTRLATSKSGSDSYGFGFSSDTSWGPYGKNTNNKRYVKEEFIYWNKRWYTKGYDITAVTDDLATNAYLPPTAVAVNAALSAKADQSEVSGKADASHAHGNITNAGAITSETTIASTDKIVLTDASNSNKLIADDQTAVLNSMINNLSTGSSTPRDADYYIAQYAGGGTTTTTFHRRPVSALWTYIKSKMTDLLDAKQDVITAGTGLEFSDTTLNHSNSITARTSYLGSTTTVPRIQIDAQGHITAYTTSTIYPPTSAGTSGQIWQSDGSGQGVWQTLDTTPTADSTKAITSGGVKTALGGYLPLTGGTVSGDVIVTGSAIGSPLIADTATSSVPYVAWMTGSASTGHTQVAQLSCRPSTNGASLLAEMGELHSSKYGYLGNYEGNTYTVTETDGLCGMVCTGTSASPGVLNLPQMSQTYSIGRKFWVYNTLSVATTVNFETQSGTLSVILGPAKSAEFLCGVSMYWTCVTGNLPIVKTLSGETYSLTLTDGVDIVTGSGSLVLPTVAGWLGRKVTVATDGSAMITVGNQYNSGGTTYTATKTAAIGSFTEYVFSGLGWNRTAGKSLA